MTHPLLVALGVAASAALLLAPFQSTWPALQPPPLEALAVVSYAWSAWLLARNSQLGWWVGLVGCVAYGKVFLDAGLLGEAGLQVFYVVTSLQAIWIWLRGGPARTERPVTHLSRRALAPLATAIALGTCVTVALTTYARGAAPVPDALVTVLSLAAHLLLMGRYVESWGLWIAVDSIAAPLYATRGMYLSSALYVVLWVVAVRGLVAFRREARMSARGAPGAVLA